MLLVSFQFSEAAIPIGFHEGGVQSRSRRCSLSAGRAQNSDSTSARGMRLQFSFTKKLSRRSTSAGKERVLPASAATTLAFPCAQAAAETRIRWVRVFPWQGECTRQDDG